MVPAKINMEVEPLISKSNWKPACLCAVSDCLPRCSLHVALAVGTVLNLINQLGMDSISWLKLILTSDVPKGHSKKGPAP